MNGQAVVSSVRLTDSPQSIHGLASIVYLGGCQSSFGREQLSSRESVFKGDNFVRIMGDTFARGGIVPHVQIDPAGSIEYAISKRGPHYKGDRLFRDTGHILEALYKYLNSIQTYNTIN